MLIQCEFANLVSKVSDRPVVFSHPVYQYFQRRYGLKAKSVHWEPDEEPTDAMWTELRQLLQKHPARVMIWEGEFLGLTANQLAELGLTSTVFDPCGNKSRNRDYLATQRKNLTALERVYSELP